MTDLSSYVPEYISIRRLMAYGISSLCIYAAWMRGGTHISLQWPLLFLALLLCVAVLFLRPGVRDSFRLKVIKDPILKVGGILLFLIIIQSLNCGYRVEPNDAGVLSFTKSPGWWMPWSSTATGSLEMLVWFFPAWISALLVRNLLTWRHVKPLLYILAWSSAALACVGIAQYMADSSKMLGIWEVQGNAFFATFAYVNHAAEWFYLNAFLAGGLAHDALVKRRPKMQQAIWCICFLLCIISVFLTLSRFGALISCILLCVAIGVYLRHTLSRKKGSAAVNIYIVAAIAIFGGLVLVGGAGGGNLIKEVKHTSVSRDMDSRLRQIPPAISMLRNYPVFGAGGGAYQSLAPLYVADENSDLLSGMQAEFVHCDPVQFLVEFGLLGGFCLAVVLAVLVYPNRRVSKEQGILSVWVLAGILVVLIHSLFDLPFRNGAMICEWTILLSVLPRLANHDAGRSV